MNSAEDLLPLMLTVSNLQVGKQLSGYSRI